MKKLKDLAIGVLINEGEVEMQVSPDMVGDIVDVNFDKNDGYIKFDFQTPYGKTASAVADLNSFHSWLQSNKGKFNDIFRYFIIDFITQSQEGDSSLNEIVDDDGNIMADDGMPNNSTNTMVTSPKFDLEKIYKSFVPKSIRFYSGDLGIGIITW